jgi:septum site-determining protein MinC
MRGRGEAEVPSEQEQPTPPRPIVTVKGGQSGLRIIVGRAAPEAVLADLKAQISRRAGAFFVGASVVLELPSGPLDLALAAQVAEAIADAGMTVKAVQSADFTARRATPDAPPAPLPAAVEPGSALWVAGTVRSGQRVSHDGALVILGDVNPGAEVLAGGSVLVWGRVRGVVEAGLTQAEDAVVCALDLMPTQLRIGAAVARAPEEPGRTPEPEVARAVDGRIVVEAWR